MRTAEHQYDCKGNHRVVVDGKTGEPTSYEHLAIVENGGKFFCAVTPYYEGTLPHDMCEGVFEMARVGDDSGDVTEYDFNHPGGPCPWIERGRPCEPTTKCPKR